MPNGIYSQERKRFHDTETSHCVLCCQSNSVHFSKACVPRQKRVRERNKTDVFSIEIAETQQSD